MMLQVLIRAEHLPHAHKRHRQDAAVAQLRRALHIPKLSSSPHAYACLSHVHSLGRVLGIEKEVVGNTEIIPNCTSPEWATIFHLSHVRGTEHRIAVDIYHCNTSGSSDAIATSPTAVGRPEQAGNTDLSQNSRQQLCGILFDVETILSHRDQMICEKIPGQEKGRLYVRLEPVHLPRPDHPRSDLSHLRLQLRGFRLHSTRRNFLERPDFCVEIRRKQRGHTQDGWGLVYRSKCVYNTLNPLFEPELLDLAILCNGNVDRELSITIVDVEHASNNSDRVRRRNVLGSCRTTIRGLIEAKSQQGNCDRNNALELAKSNRYTNPKGGIVRLGRLVVVHAELVSESGMMSASSESGDLSRMSTMSADIVIETSASHAMVDPMQAEAVAVQIMPPPNTTVSLNRFSQPSFADFFRSDRCTLELCVAIDFTSSNGDFRVAGTTHYTAPGRLNDYEWTMKEVGQFVAKYNRTCQFPVWGFGAMFGGKTYHVFQVGPSSRANGAAGLLDSYRSAFQTRLAFGDETRYDDVVQAAAHFSQKQLDEARRQSELSYSALLVLTTGQEKDILRSIEKLAAVQSAPLSIIFVRIDNGSSHPPLTESKLEDILADRGIRPFCTFLDGRSFERKAGEFREKRCLGGIESQFVNYFLSRRIMPT